MPRPCRDNVRLEPDGKPRREVRRPRGRQGRYAGTRRIVLQPRSIRRAERLLTAAKAPGSHGQILRSSTIIGGAAIANIAVGLARTKIAALLLGPVGVGLIGLLQSLVSTGTAVAGLGIANSSVRQLAEAAGNDDTRGVTANRRALFYAAAILALLGIGGFWMLRVPLAQHVLGDPSESRTVAWLGIAVALTIASNSQLSLLNGLRRIGDMARVNVFGAMLGTCLGITALVLWRSGGIVAYVISAPLAVLIVGILILRKVPSEPVAKVSLADIGRCSVPMIRLGFSFMVAGLCTTAAFLAVRAIVNQRLSTTALGQFSAAWMISMTYIAFVLQAMGTDYYPRLTAAIRDSKRVNRMVNEQSEVAILLAAPILLGMQAGAPWVINILYSSEFAPAVAVLRWQIMGDVLKIVSWPLGFIILASGQGRLFVITEALAVATYTIFVWVGIEPLGLVSTGVGFVAMYAVYLPAVYLLARRRTGFAWSSRTAWAASALFSAVTLSGFLGQASDLLGLTCGTLLALLFGGYALRRLSSLGALHGRLAFLDKVAACLPFGRANAATEDQGSL